MDNEALVLLEARGSVALITLNRPEVRNAQNGALIYELDAAYARFIDDDDLAVAVLRGAGKSFSAGHDIGPGGDRDVTFERKGLWWDHVNKTGAANRWAREEELYLGLCKRWRRMPKPTIALVHGACIAGGLMLAWSCDLIVASSDAFFADPVVTAGLPGMEYFVHPWMMGGRQAREFLFTGRRIHAEEALGLGMINYMYDADEVLERTLALASSIARMPRMGLALAKDAVNRFEDAMGLTVGMDSAFGLHQLAHAHNAETTGDPNGGLSPGGVREVMNDSQDHTG